MAQQLHSQDDGVVALNIPTRNSLKFNRQFINPTFSFVREQNKYISFNNKREWVQFNDAPKTYLLGYSGRFQENIGAGFSLFQQNYGVLTTFGGLLNFAYNAVLDRSSNLTFGINTGFYKSGIDRGNVIINSPDSSLDNFPSNSIITIHPGINYGTDFLDFGVSIKHLVSYNFTTSKMIENNLEQGVQGHIMYTGYLKSRGFFDESRFSSFLSSEFRKDETIVSAMVILMVPKGVWAQAGYNSLYALSAGIGVNISRQVAIEYNYENGVGGFSTFGNSHDITLAYKFKNNERYDYSGDDQEDALIISSNKKKKKLAKRKHSFKTKTRKKAKPFVAKKDNVKDDKITEVETQKNTNAKIKAVQEKESRIAKVKAAQAEQARLAEFAKIKADAAAKAKREEDAKVKAAQVEQARLAELAKIKADAAAKAKREEDAKVKAAQVEQARLAEFAKIKADAAAKAKREEDAKVKAAQAEQARLAELAKIKADAAAKAKREEDAKVKAEQIEQARLAKLTKIKADAAAKAKREEDAKVKAAQVEQARLAELAKINADAAAKAKREEDAKVKAAQVEQARLAELAKIKAEEGAKAKQEKQTKLAEEEKLTSENETRISEEILDEVLIAFKKSAEASSSAQKVLLDKLNKKVNSKQQDLDDLKQENDLSEKGISSAPKAFKSISAENAEIESLKLKIDNSIELGKAKISEIQSLRRKRLNKRKNDALNQAYLNTIQTLKSELQQAENMKQNLISTLSDIKIATDFERRRRIKRAAYDNDTDRYNKDRATLQRIKTLTSPSTTLLTKEDFDYGEALSNIQIVKGANNTEDGYYLVIAVHTNIIKRDEFLRKAIAAGENNINFFFDVNSNKYYIYYDKFDKIGEAKSTLDANKGSKPYNREMNIVKIEN